MLPIHKSAVDAEYKPGIDIEGNPVAPADLNAGTAFELPETIKIPLTVELADRFALEGFESDALNAPLGIIEIMPDGQALYQGRDITSQAIALCQKTPDINSHGQSE